MIGGDASPGSRQHRLDVDSALAEVLLERATLDAGPECAATAQRGREALNLLEESKPAASARPTSVRASSTSVRSLPMLAGARRATGPGRWGSAPSPM
jgi:hypothetical protein